MDKILNNMRLVILFQMAIKHIDYQLINIIWAVSFLCQNAFTSSGATRGTELSMEHLLNRTSRSKTSAVAKITHKSRHSYLEDVEIGVQEQHTSSVELGLSHRQYSGNTVSDLYLFYRQGIKGLGAKVQKLGRCS